MSDYEAWKGKLKKVTNKQNEELEQYCKELLSELNAFDPDSKKKPSHYLVSEFYEEYLLLNGFLYQFVEKEKVPDEADSFCNLTINEDETVSFFTRYYNGGTYLNEMIEDEFIEKDI